jgi:branched-chain amino acid transport system ATP-binding protein
MLRAANLTKRFGGLTAVDDVGFSLERGEILGLIGPNGAGKSTLVNLVTGFDRPDRGTVQLDENTLRDTSPARRARLGLSRTFQRPRLVANVSVEDLLTGAAWIVGAPRWFVRSRRAAQEVERVLDELGLQPIRRALVQELASPSLRLVQIAMTVLTGCRYMMLDEPVAGLSVGETERVGALVRGLAARGTGIVVIEHNVGFVRRLANRILVIDRGAMIAAGPTDEVLASRRVIEAYLGAEPTGAAAP